MPGEHLAGPVIIAVGGGLRIWLQLLEQRIVGLLGKPSEGGGQHGFLGFWSGLELAPTLRPSSLLLSSACGQSGGKPSNQNHLTQAVII
jgi:hypothetical protein